MILTGWLTVFASDTIMPLVKDGVLIGSRQLDMGNSGVRGWLETSGLTSVNAAVQGAPGPDVSA